MSFITDLLGGSQIKMVAGLVLVTTLACGAFGIWMHIHSLDSQVTTLQTQVTTLTANNKILQENNEVVKNDLIAAQDANSTDNKTITDLLNERSDAQEAVTRLSTQVQSNQKQAANLQAQLAQLKKNPANDGKLSPDLRETIRSIQQQKGE